jgi:hypothetical protein
MTHEQLEFCFDITPEPERRDGNLFAETAEEAISRLAGEFAEDSVEEIEGWWKRLPGREGTGRSALPTREGKLSGATVALDRRTCVAQVSANNIGRLGAEACRVTPPVCKPSNERERLARKPQSPASCTTSAAVSSKSTPEPHDQNQATPIWLASSKSAAGS